MGTFFAIIFFASAVSILVLLAISVYMFFFQKDNYKKWLVRAGIAVGVLIVSVIGGVSTSSTPEQRAEMEQKRITEQAQKEQERAEKEARKAQEAAQKEQEAAEKKEREAQATKEEAAINKAIPETVQEMKDKRYHPMVADAYIEVDYNKKLVTMTVVVNPTTDKSAALDLADTMIRRFSSNVLTHDSSFTAPSGNSYGSLFDEYDIAIAIAQVQHKDNRSKWLYDQYITKGMHTKQGPDWKSAK
nr:MAG TPA: Selenoprotein S (SelS) [Caudoviricetes sp.]